MEWDVCFSVDKNGKTQTLYSRLELNSSAWTATHKNIHLCGELDHNVKQREIKKFFKKNHFEKKTIKLRHNIPDWN